MGQYAGDLPVETDEIVDTEATQTTAEAMADDLRSMTGAEPQDTVPEQVAGGTEEVPDSTSTAEPPATEDVIQIGDVVIAADQVDAVVGLLNWASGLTEDQAAAAFAAASGHPIEPQIEQPAPPPAPAIPDDLAETYPEVAEQFRKMQEEMEQLRSSIGQVEQVAGQVAYNDTRELIDTTELRVRDEFLQKHGLSEDDYTKLTATAAELGVVPSLVQNFGLEEGFRRSLDIAYASNPDLQQREIQTRIQQAQTNTKKQNAASLTPQGGSAPRTNPDPASLPVSEKRKAMIDEIRELTGMN